MPNTFKIGYASESDLLLAHNCDFIIDTPKSHSAGVLRLDFSAEVATVIGQYIKENNCIEKTTAIDIHLLIHWESTFGKTGSGLETSSLLISADILQLGHSLNFYIDIIETDADPVYIELCRNIVYCRYTDPNKETTLRIASLNIDNSVHDNIVLLVESLMPQQTAFFTTFNGGVGNTSDLECATHEFDNQTLHINCTKGFLYYVPLIQNYIIEGLNSRNYTLLNEDTKFYQFPYHRLNPVYSYESSPDLISAVGLDNFLTHACTNIFTPIYDFTSNSQSFIPYDVSYYASYMLADHSTLYNVDRIKESKTVFNLNNTSVHIRNLNPNNNYVISNADKFTIHPNPTASCINSKSADEFGDYVTVTSRLLNNEIPQCNLYLSSATIKWISSQADNTIFSYLCRVLKCFMSSIDVVFEDKPVSLQLPLVDVSNIYRFGRASVNTRHVINIILDLKDFDEVESAQFVEQLLDNWISPDSFDLYGVSDFSVFMQNMRAKRVNITTDNITHLRYVKFINSQVEELYVKPYVQNLFFENSKCNIYNINHELHNKFLNFDKEYTFVDYPYCILSPTFDIKIGTSYYPFNSLEKVMLYKPCTNVTDLEPFVWKENVEIKGDDAMTVSLVRYSFYVTCLKSEVSLYTQCRYLTSYDSNYITPSKDYILMGVSSALISTQSQPAVKDFSNRTASSDSKDILDYSTQNISTQVSSVPPLFKCLRTQPDTRISGKISNVISNFNNLLSNYQHKPSYISPPLPTEVVYQLSQNTK